MKRALLAGVLVLVLAPAPSAAHVRSTTGYSEITQRYGAVAYRLSLESELLAKAAGHGPPADYVLPRVEVSVDGVRCEGRSRAPTASAVTARPHRSRPALDYACPGAAEGAYTVRYGVFADGAVVDDHRNIVDYRPRRRRRHVRLRLRPPRARGRRGAYR